MTTLHPRNDFYVHGMAAAVTPTLPSPAQLGDVLTRDEARSCITTDDCWRELHLPGHPGAALVVWNMEDTAAGRNPACEAQAERLAACWNACQGVPTAELLAPPSTPAWEPLTPEVVERLDKESDAARPEAPYYWLADKKAGRVRWGCFAYQDEHGSYFKDGDSYFEGADITHIMPFTTPEMPK